MTAREIRAHLRELYGVAVSPDLISRVREGRARGPTRVLRRLGRHPGDGAPVWLKTGRCGPFVAHRRRYASLPGDVALEDVTLERALALLDG